MLTSLVSGVDYVNELKLFTKLHQQSYEVLALFFQKHREIMFLKFEATLINSILDFAMKGLAEAQNYELQSQATAIIVSFNEFCYEKLQKSPNEKGTSNNCVQNVQAFYQQNSQVFLGILKALVYALIFVE